MEKNKKEHKHSKKLYTEMDPVVVPNGKTAVDESVPDAGKRKPQTVSSEATDVSSEAAFRPVFCGFGIGIVKARDLEIGIERISRQRNEIIALKKEIAAARQENEDLRQMILKKDEQIKAGKDERRARLGDSVEDLRTSYREILANMQTESADARAERAQIRDAVTAVIKGLGADQNQTAQEQIQEMQAEIAKEKAALAQEKAKLARDQSEAQAAVADMEEVRRQFDFYEKLFEGVQGDMGLDDRLAFKANLSKFERAYNDMQLVLMHCANAHEKKFAESLRDILTEIEDIAKLHTK